jgi:hypothetical protein
MFVLKGSGGQARCSRRQAVDATTLMNKNGPAAKARLNQQAAFPGDAA